MLERDFRDQLHRPGIWPLLLLTLCSALLPLFWNVPLWAALFCSVVLIVSFRWRERVPRKIVLFAALVATIGVVLSLHSLLTREAGVALIVLMAAFKLLETRNARDAHLLCALALFLLFTNFLLHTDLLFSAYTLVCLPLPLLCLLRINRRADHAPLWPLFLRVLRLLGLALPLMLVLYIFFPRLSVPLWSLPGQGKTGMSEEMTIGDVQDLAQDTTPAFHVRFKDAIPDAQRRYWRAVIVDRFDGITWHHTSSNALPEEINQLAPSVNAADTVYDYQINLQPTNSNWLPALDVPLAGTTLASLVYGHTLQLPYKGRTETEYRLQALRQFQWGKLLSPNNRLRYLQLPETGNPRARNWAQELRNRSIDANDFARQLAQHIHSQAFYYTLHAPILEENIIDDFWFNQRRGYCEHYANAAAFLLRAAGIPSRVVLGYQGGEWNAFGRYFVVRQSDAHAWVEYWQEEQGWHRFDPTAAIAAERVEQELISRARDRSDWLADGAWLQNSLNTGLLNQLQSAWTTALQWYDASVVRFQRDSQRDWLTKLGLSDVEWPTLLKALLVGFTLTAALALAILFRPQRVDDPASRLWLRFARRMARLGVVREQGESAEQFILRCQKRLPQQRSVLKQLMNSYLAARFAGDSNALQKMKSHWRELRLPWRARFGW